MQSTNIRSSFDSLTSFNSEYDDTDVDEDTERVGGEETTTAFAESKKPIGTKPMASWYEYSMAQTAIDLFIHASIFAGRFDMRHLLGTTSTFDVRSEVAKEVGTQSDPYYFDHSQNHSQNHSQEDHASDGNDEEMWFDFMADCGDGFDSSYAIARLLAQPTLRASFSPTTGSSTKQGIVTKRGRVLLIGGDLAYPNPTRENYEERFVRVFEDAMQPPTDHPLYYESQNVAGVISSGSFGSSGSSSSLSSPSGSSSSSSSSSSLPPPPRDTPTAYVVPGNHDWFDGLASFMRYVIYRDRLGGWLLPQRRSYFALELPHNWWLFGMDDGLEGELDPHQHAYFAALSERLPAHANVIVMSHNPSWVTDVVEGETEEERRRRRTRMHQNLEHLMDTSLRGKVRLRLAG